MIDELKDLEAQAEPIDTLEKRLKLLQRYGVRTYRDGKLSIDIATITEPKKKRAEDDSDSLVRGQ